MTKRPAFQFYPGDWLSSTNIALMTPEQEGAYVRLLCHMWNNNCVLPDDDDILAQLSRLGEGWFNGGSTVVRKCFIEHPTEVGYLTNRRLLEERRKQDEWKAKSIQGGLNSAEARRKQKVKGGSKMVATKGQPKGNSSSSSSSSNKKKKNKKENVFLNLKPNSLSLEHWVALLGNRKHKKLQNTELGLKRFVASLNRGVSEGYSMTECVEEYIESNWQKFKPEWMPKKSDPWGR